MTIQGAIEELQILFNAKNVPIYYKSVIKEIIETIQMDTVPKDFHDKTCEAMAKRHTEEIQRYMWIPCSERLPEEFVYVLVCLTDGTMDVAQLTDYLDIWGEPKWCRDTTHTLGGAILSSEIVAWMPLPKPYKESE